MSLAKEISVRAFRTVLYPPVGVFWGAIIGGAVAVVLLFWAWLLDLFMHFDLKDVASGICAICVGLGVIGGFLTGLWNGIFEEVE